MGQGLPEATVPIRRYSIEVTTLPWYGRIVGSNPTVGSIHQRTEDAISRGVLGNTKAGCGHEGLPAAVLLRPCSHFLCLLSSVVRASVFEAELSLVRIQLGACSNAIYWTRSSAGERRPDMAEVKGSNPFGSTCRRSSTGRALTS